MVFQVLWFTRENGALVGDGNPIKDFPMTVYATTRTSQVFLTLPKPFLFRILECRRWGRDGREICKYRDLCGQSRILRHGETNLLPEQARVGGIRGPSTGAA